MAILNIRAPKAREPSRGSLHSFWVSRSQGLQGKYFLIWDHIMDKTFHDRCYDVLLHFCFSTHWYCWVEETSKSLDTALKCAHSWTNVPDIRRSDHNHTVGIIYFWEMHLRQSPTIEDSHDELWQVWTKNTLVWDDLGAFWSQCACHLQALISTARWFSQKV